MADVLPQQRLLLELLVMSGDIAVPHTEAPGILWRTLDECAARHWIKKTEISPGLFRIEITGAGRGRVGS